MLEDHHVEKEYRAILVGLLEVCNNRTLPPPHHDFGGCPLTLWAPLGSAVIYPPAFLYPPAVLYFSIFLFSISISTHISLGLTQRLSAINPIHTPC